MYINPTVQTVSMFKYFVIGSAPFLQSYEHVQTAERLTYRLRTRKVVGSKPAGGILEPNIEKFWIWSVHHPSGLTQSDFNSGYNLKQSKFLRQDNLCTECNSSQLVFYFFNFLDHEVFNKVKNVPPHLPVEHSTKEVST